MRAWIDDSNTLHIAPDDVYEALALRGWIKENEIQNVSGVNLMPSRHFIVQTRLDTERAAK